MKALEILQTELKRRNDFKKKVQEFRKKPVTEGPLLSLKAAITLPYKTDAVKLVRQYRAEAKIKDNE